MVNGLVYIDASASIIQTVCNVVNAFLSGWVDLYAAEPVNWLGAEYVNALAVVAVGIADMTARLMSNISL